MKYSNILLWGMSLALMTSCISELDTYPQGATITQDQKDAIGEKNPEKLAADLQGMYNGFTAAMNTFGKDNNIHFDYSYPAITMILESDGMDMVSKVTGYNWFSGCVTYTDRVNTTEETTMIWKRFYGAILAANSLVKSVKPDTKDPELMAYLGEAKAMRAFCYFQLAQALQFTYFGNQNKPCVPIITEESTGSNHPRQTVEKVYEQIMKDLESAIGLLGTAYENQVSRADKGRIDVFVAHGIRARVELVMHDYVNAKKDAEMALKSSGAAPYSLADVSKPAFNSASSSAWLWGLLYTPESSAVKTSIVNWPSHLCSMSKTGYTSTGTHRMINSNLWAKISESDVRRGWWVDEELSSPLTDNLKAGGNPVSKAFKFTPYTNVKFGAYKDDPNNSDNAQDFPMMRVEEMKLIIIECMAIDNPSGAKEELEKFIQECRDPDYTCSASTTQDMLDEVWFQRRIELWGEGFAFYDLLRLNKAVDRRNSNFESSVQFYIEPNSPILLFRIPQSEIESNLGIDESQNNPSAPAPEA